MIADSPGLMILLLAVLTLLGGVIGYCIALILVKNSARRVIEDARMKMLLEHPSADTMPNAQVDGIGKLPASQQYDRSASERERALVEKAQGQARHIQSLEEQVSSLEAQQRRLQQHFASFKANINRQIVEAREVPGRTEELPTLSRRIDPVTGRVIPSVSPAASQGGRLAGTRRDSQLSDEDIPTLTESKKSKRANEMEYDIAGSGRDDTSKDG